MTPKQAVDSIIEGLKEMPAMLSGDDSPLLNTWEEMKDQLQGELSSFWSAYVETLHQAASGLVANLDDDARSSLRESLKTHSDATVERKLTRSVLSRGKREPVQYKPFDFDYFCYRLLDFTVYGRVIQRTGLRECRAQAFSVAAPTGEYGTIDCARIDTVLTAEEFNDARARSWPVTWSES
jgi:hypothetical protein